MGKLILGLTLFLAGIAIGFGAQIAPGKFTAEAIDAFAANAGPDQRAEGPGPVMVQFDGSGSQPSHECGPLKSFKWYNQWGALRAETVSPAFKVNFGKNPKPGTTRTFTLEVEAGPPENDLCEGPTARDSMTVTLVEDLEEQSQTITVNGDEEGDSRDYTFSRYSVEYAYEGETGELLMEIYAGIIDTDAQDYAYVFVTRDENETSLGGADCHGDEQLWTPWIGSRSLKGREGTGCVTRLADATNGPYQVGVSRGGYENVWDITVEGPNGGLEDLHVELNMPSDSRTHSENTWENSSGYGKVQDAPPGFPPSESPPPSLDYDPAAGSIFLGTSVGYKIPDENDWQFIDAGFLDQDRWYISVSKNLASVECHHADHNKHPSQTWETDFHQGCVGDIGIMSDRGVVGITPLYDPFYVGPLVSGWSLWAGEVLLAEVTLPESKPYILDSAYTAVNHHR